MPESSTQASIPLQKKPWKNRTEMLEMLLSSIWWENFTNFHHDQHHRHSSHRHNAPSDSRIQQLHWSYSKLRNKLNESFPQFFEKEQWREDQEDDDDDDDRGIIVPVSSEREGKIHGSTSIRGLKTNFNLTLLSALNEVMKFLNCKPFSMVEILQVVLERLQKSVKPVVTVDSGNRQGGEPKGGKKCGRKRKRKETEGERGKNGEIKMDLDDSDDEEDEEEVFVEPPCMAEILCLLFAQRGLHVQDVAAMEAEENVVRGRRRLHRIIRKSTFLASELEIGEQCVFIADKVRPIFATFYPVPSVRSKHRETMLKLLLPIADPVPLERRVRVVKHISHRETNVLLISKHAITATHIRKNVSVNPSEDNEDYDDASEEKEKAEPVPTHSQQGISDAEILFQRYTNFAKLHRKKARKRLRGKKKKKTSAGAKDEQLGGGGYASAASSRASFTSKNSADDDEEEDEELHHRRENILQKIQQVENCLKETAGRLRPGRKRKDDDDFVGGVDDPFSLLPNAVASRRKKNRRSQTKRPWHQRLLDKPSLEFLDSQMLRQTQEQIFLATQEQEAGDDVRMQI